MKLVPVRDISSPGVFSVVVVGSECHCFTSGPIVFVASVDESSSGPPGHDGRRFPAPIPAVRAHRRRGTPSATSSTRRLPPLRPFTAARRNRRAGEAFVERSDARTVTSPIDRSRSRSTRLPSPRRSRRRELPSRDWEMSTVPAHVGRGVVGRQAQAASRARFQNARNSGS
jgi:hypothetical protein